TKGQVMPESVMITLVGKGMSRQGAHKLVQDAAKRARDKDVHLRDALVADPKVVKLLTKKEIDAALDPDNYLGASVEIVDRVVKKCG
ncbi:MAG: adenylosuccinate lyase, partial [Candidatus Thermoplasmatota archaeon]